MGIGCLVTGSRIRTAHSEIAVEDLFAGDEIVTLRDGVETIEPVTWIGQRHLDLAAQAHPESLVPVRVRAHAIADGQPHRDLLLSQDHCLFLDGKCVPARLLVNGGSISFERDAREVTYFHVELAKHGIMFAEGLPSESYLNTGNRGWFSNADEPTTLHPSFTENKDAGAWLTDACAPLATAGEEVKPIWSRLATRSEDLGYAPSVVKTTPDAEVRLSADGATIRPTSAGNGVYNFVVPAGTRSVQLQSRFGIPVDIEAPYLGDTRRLGVRVKQIAVRSDAGEIVISGDDPRLTEGWYDAEREDAEIWRWTDGAADLPWSNVAGSAVVTVHCTTLDLYPMYDEMLRLVA